MATDAATYDILDFAGINDAYTEGKPDAQRNRTSSPTSGYSSASIMTERSGTQLESQQLQQAKSNPTTKQCSGDAGKPVCN